MRRFFIVAAAVRLRSDRTEHSLGVRLTVNTSSRNSEEGGLSWLGRQGKMSEVQLDFQEVRRKC